MPGLVRKLVIVAAVDGLIVQPAAQRNQSGTPGLRIPYASSGISAIDSTSRREDGSSTSIDAYGIVGLLSVASIPYLISIERRQQVAQISNCPIYVVTGVNIIPLTSYKDASSVILQARRNLEAESNTQTPETNDESDTSEEEDHHLFCPTESIQLASKAPAVESSSVAEDVIGKRGQYGRFAERWFSRKGWSTDQKRMLGMSTKNVADGGSASSIPERAREVDAGGPDSEDFSKSNPPSNEQGLQANQVGNDKFSGRLAEQSINATLLPKLLKTTSLLLASRNLYFAYDYDITRRLGSQERKSEDVPLYRSVDPMFFWNHHLAAPLIAGLHHSYVLPLMMGFVGQRVFSPDVAPGIPAKAIARAEESFTGVTQTQENPQNPNAYLITLISRRSTLRPGLRYLRRGMDDLGNVANLVETEQILSKAAWDKEENVYSFTSARGSIPLFFSQSPYAFKPVPTLQRSLKANHDAFRRHFANLVKGYGPIHAVSLVDKTGGEAAIGEQYEKHTQQLNTEGGISGTEIGFQWFDFHAVCRGMKFENVKLLVDSLENALNRFGFTIERGGKLLRKQIGVVRTNCMDCLDRTNVAQSACASRILEKQLLHEGIEVDLANDPTTHWFNTLWADNGDAISKQYSSTAALKGDYTRTRKRNYKGAINDLGLTLSRYYNNIVSDFFSQAAIDYLLGNVDSSVFEDFEANMMSGDPGISMSKIRANAIEICSKMVIADQHEDLINGWTMLSPQLPNTIRTFPFEEVILLLTNAALYSVRFDWNTDKVSSYQRVDICSISCVIRGTYITSTLAAAQMDEQKNVGIIIRYSPGKGDVQRRNTRSMSTVVGKEHDQVMERALASPGFLPNLGIESALSRISGWGSGSDVKLLAFKALGAQSSRNTQLASGFDSVQSISNEINRVALEARDSSLGEEKKPDSLIEEHEIISLDEAKRSTGYLEQWSHSLKKFVWA